MQHQFFTKLQSQINYSNSEKKIRSLPEYQEILSKLQPGGKVLKYQDDQLDVNLTSNFGDKKIRQIKVPVCIEDCNHEIFDLYDIFLYKEQVQCKNCKKKATKKNIKREEFYSKIIYSMSEKCFSCSIIGQLFFHSFSKDIQTKARELLQNTEYKQLFIDVVKSSENPSKRNQIKAILLEEIDKKQRELTQNNNIHINRIVEFPFQCLINCQKIIIPIYLNECKHLDCYEFTSILKLINDNKKLPEIYQRKFVKCFKLNCKTQIHLDINQLKQQLIFPYELASAISKDYPFSMKLVWDFQKSGFEYQKIKIQDFLQNQVLKTTLQNEPTIDYQILILLKKIINKEMSNQLQNKLNFSKYKVNLNQIQFPCRCIYCELQNVKDIEEFILQHINQSKSNSFTCPGCNYIHYNYGSLEKIIYFDRYLYNAQLKKQDHQQFEYNKDDDKFQKFFFLHQQIDFKQVKINYSKNNIYPYSNQFCALSSKKIKQPLTLIFCKEKRTVELKSLKKFLEKNQFSFYNFPNCNCTFCKAKESLEITDFYYDPIYYQILAIPFQDQKLNEHIKTQLTSQYFDNKRVTDEIPQIKKIAQQYNEQINNEQKKEKEEQQFQQQQQLLYQQQQLQQQHQQIQQLQLLVQQYDEQQQQQSLQLQQQQYQLQQFQQQQQNQLFLQQQEQQYQQPSYQYSQPFRADQQSQHHRPLQQNFINNQNNQDSETQSPLIHEGSQSIDTTQRGNQQFIYIDGQLIPLQLYQMRYQQQ
ncbi:unnamed protein product [Paramecium primaurelia]|uniref:Uncharacterized protein n=1 Tax=Paramecium primaurelia TaxID=5886 RepID=A0A8S1PGW3_PARPR|nr:unnamed protein product [Paramecium primaurelia]